MHIHPIEKAPKTISVADLNGISRGQLIKALVHPLAWLSISWALYSSALWPVGLLSSFMFFLCGLRLNHEAIHNNLGLMRKTAWPCFLGSTKGPEPPENRRQH